MKLTRSTKETVVIVALAIVAVLAIVAILWNQDTAGATAANSGHSYKHDIYSQPTTSQPAAVYTVEITRPQITAYNARPDACRTYNIGGVDATDGISCGDVVTVATVTEQPAEVRTVANSDTVETVKETVTETPSDKKQKGNNGNHYGNDKPDQNPKDVKNPHNGEQTAADHHDSNGNSDNSHGNGNGGH